MQTMVSEGQGRIKKGGSINGYAGLSWSKTWLKKWLRDMWNLRNGTFEWLESYKPIKNLERNIFLNISILILMLTLKNIKMRETATNSLKSSFKHIHSTHN